jgi:hypothetical protein
MPTPQLYPYKLRVQFTAAQEAGLKAAAGIKKRSITDVIRTYVEQGLARDGITGEPPAPIEGQITIEDDTPEGDDA